MNDGDELNNMAIE